MVDKAITESRKAEVQAREETIRDYILRVFEDAKISKRFKKVTPMILVDELRDQFPPTEIIDEIFKMGKEKFLTGMERQKTFRLVLLLYLMIITPSNNSFNRSAS